MSTENNEIGLVGLGLMGSSIIAALLVKGETVVGLAPLPEDLQKGPTKIKHYVELAYESGFSDHSVEQSLSRLTITENYEDLKHCKLVMECVKENIDIKQKVFDAIEKNVSSDTIICTNTSAIPITILKDFLKIPSRFMGMHWAEPAFTTRFLEIICSTDTEPALAEKAYSIATKWGKEPTLVRKDIRGFITNRMMYAMFREAFNLVENGYASVEDVDRACRNDAGQWLPFCGLFRYMDITGLQAYYTVMKDLFPTLSNQTTVPALIENIAADGGNGISNGKGFYTYTDQEASEWEKAYEEFAVEISKLTARYPIDMVEKRIKNNE